MLGFLASFLTTKKPRNLKQKSMATTNVGILLFRDKEFSRTFAQS